MVNPCKLSFNKGKTFNINGKIVKEKKSITIYIVLIMAFLIYISGLFVGFEFEVLIKNGKNFFDILVDMINLDFSYIPKIILPMIDTLTMSLLGTVIGALLALPTAFYCSSNLNKNKWTLNFVRTILSIVRTIPVLVYALILTYIFGIGTFAGFLAITIFTYSICTKMLYEQIETLDNGPFEAMESTGSSKVKATWIAIFPQLRPFYFSTLLYNFEMNVRSAAILGYVGAGGIGLILDEAIGYRKYGRVGMILVILILTVILIETVSRTIRKKLG